MRKLLFSIAIIFISLSLSSCIDLIEEVSINKDLSGKYEMRLETSGLGGMMSQMGGVPDIPQIQELDEKLSVLRSQSGISNIKKDFNAKELKFNISFDFENEKALNNALYALAEIKPNMFLKKFLKIKNNKVVRPNLSPYIQRLLEEQNISEQIPSEDMLNYVNYKFIVNTPKDIKKTSGKRAMVQSNKATVISSFSFKELLINKENVYLKIKM